MTHDEVLASVAGWIVREEGGVADVGDGAGLTRWGQTMGWLTQWNLPVPTTKEEAITNYVAWLGKSHLSGLASNNDILLTIVADFAINSGEGPAIMSLQAALGVPADSILGHKTISASLGANQREIALVVLADRQERNGSVIASHPDRFARFARGWSARYGRQMRRIARGMDG